MSASAPTGVEIDRRMLADLGLDVLPPSDQASLLRFLRATLERRVGEVLTDRLTPEQTVEFEALYTSGDHDEARRWLYRQVPGIADVVRAEFDRLRGEMQRDAWRLLAILGAR